MSSKPTLIFVPGAWHIASTWDKVIAMLSAQGYKCVAITLPTTTSDPSKEFSDDLHAIRSAIVAETSEGRDVVVVVHSYGGAVGISAIKGLTPSKENTSATPVAKAGHVIGIASMGSGFGPSGITFLEGFGGSPPPIWNLNYDTGYVIIVCDARELFYHDLPQEEGEYWVGKLQNQSLKALTTGADVAYAGWMDVPVWYLGTTADKALPIEAQKHFLKVAQDAGADVTYREVDSSHSPMLSQPKITADFILEAVTAFVG